MRKRGWLLAIGLRQRWLEALLVLALLALLGWYGKLGLGFVPRPTPVPTPSLVRTVPTGLPLLPLGTPTAPDGLIVPLPTAQGTQAPLVTGVLPSPTAAPSQTPSPTSKGFDGNAAYLDVLAQTKLGPRPPGSTGDRSTRGYITGILHASGWAVTTQPFTYMGTSCENIIAKAGEGPVIVVGAGYDTRRQADQDPDPALREEPVPGANGSASGVAVLLELARTLNKSQLSNQVWLLFMDAEDNGGLDGWDPLAGAHFFADHLSTSPQAVIILDMIGYKNQQIYQERNSTPALQDEIFAIAAKLGYDAFFIPQYRWQVQDAHTAFLAHGWPATDIIDFDYPYWHTSHDTADEVSPDALGRVGRVLQAFLQKTS